MANDLDVAFDTERAETIRTRSRYIWLASIVVWIVSLVFFDLEVFSLERALAIRVPEFLLAGASLYFLRKPRGLLLLEAWTVAGWGLMATLSGFGLMVVPPEKLPAKVASLVLAVLFVCPLAAFTWRATLAIAVVTMLSLTGLLFVGAGSLYRLSLTAVGFAYGVLIVGALARDRLKLAELKARSELAAANEKLKHEDELKRRLFVNLSHDFRTPLAVMRGEASLLRASGRFGADEASLYRVEANARALTDLVDQLLDLARLEAGQMPIRTRRCDVGSIARDVAALLEPPEGAARIEVTLAAEPSVALVDPSHLERMLSNLVVNALRQRDASCDRPGTVGIVVVRDGDSVRIDVVDDGPGVPAARRDAVFQRFVSFDSDGSTASGIGLPLSRELAVLNGGALSIVDVARSTFRLTLPAVDGAPDADARATTNGAPLAPAATIAPAREGDGRGPRVLVVEDNLDMGDLIGRVLGDRFRVDHVARVADAIAYLRDDPPAAVVSDVLLADGNGYDVLAMVRGSRELEGLPVVLVSALGEVPERVRGLAHGADDYVPKPFAPEELRSRVAAAIDRADGRKRALAGQREALLMEVHDGVSASLSRASMLLSEPGAVGASEAAGHARDAIRDGLDEVRGITRLLAPAPATLGVLSAEIRRAMADACAAASLSLDFDATGNVDGTVSAAVAHTMRRIAREATTNAVKHARATKITCRMSATPEAFALRVEDDGRGIAGTSDDGLGLGIMRRRASRVGGEVSYGNVDGGRSGAFVALRIPRDATT